MALFPILLIGAPLLGIGAFLFKRGWWPRRVGDTPHCPKCDYILSGDQSRCPECGATVESGNVVRGDRHRRLAMAGIGGAMGLFGLLFLIVSVSGILVHRINWRGYEPLSWLLKDVSNISSPAWVEVQRRLDNNLLSLSEQDAVVERGLQVQNMPSENLMIRNVLDFIGQRYLDQKLTSSQADRFFANMLKVNMVVRSVVGAQSQIPYCVIKVGRPVTNWSYRMRILESQLDDGPVQRNIYTNSSGGRGFGGLSINRTLEPVAKPGKHRLRFKVEMTTGATGGVSANWDEKAFVSKRVTQDLLAVFEVVEGDTPIATVTMPDAAAMRSLLTPRLTINSRLSQQLNFYLFASALRVDAAFDVYIRFRGKEFLLGRAILYSGPSGDDTYYTWPNTFLADLPSNVDVILRSNEDLARQTVDVKRIWKGEIVVPNVPIDRAANVKP